MLAKKDTVARRVTGARTVRVLCGGVLGCVAARWAHTIPLDSVVTIIELVEPEFRVISSFEHPYPPTKIAFAPDKVRARARCVVTYTRRGPLTMCGGLHTGALGVAGHVG